MTDWLTDLVAWGWDRHHNVLSWYIRPLFFLPFCFFAYRRSLTGIVVTLVALLTSFAWFPAPEVPSAAVNEMLDAERDYLLGEWTGWKVAIALLIPLVFTGLALALWRRSFAWALVVVNAGVLFKVAWTFWLSGTDGAMAHLPAALVGLAVVDAVLLLVARRKRTAVAVP
ncbi:hypothetical protein ACFFQW_19270 [Umezawaea endophytica]|uniref:Uncharacterized protein n=1 Tax=Umezawaea endophytica TaxID=1654476 RepID=A0A9X3A2W7_9PSEU|nr:hypothetical protein [Umezawaea endophytica]MCS7479548.1 hypothetical protein [Umezawaea endophytica]